MISCQSGMMYGIRLELSLVIRSHIYKGRDCSVSVHTSLTQWARISPS